MSSEGENQNGARLTKGPIGSTLLAMTGPMMLGTFSTMAFNLVDTWFVSQLGARELAAISFTFPVIMLVMFVSMGLGTGVSAALSRVIGSENHTTVQRLATDSLLLGLLIVSFCVVTGLTTIAPLFRALGADDELIPLIRQYMELWYPGMLFLVVPMIGNSLIRATGDTRRPAQIMIGAALVNLILDPILIFGLGPIPQLGLTGAALATVIARFFTLIASLWILHGRLHLLTFAKTTWQRIIYSWKQILRVALPSTATNIVVPVSMAVAIRLLATFGEPAVAAFGAATRIEAFILLPVTSLTMTLLPFTGQNWGAGLTSRVFLAHRWCLKFAFIIGAVFALFLWCIASPLASFMTDDPQVQRWLTLYLRLVPWGYSFQGIYRLATGMMNGMDQANLSTLLNAMRMLIFYIPLAWGFGQIWHLAGFFFGIALANILTGILCLWIMERIFRRLGCVGQGDHA